MVRTMPKPSSFAKGVTTVDEDPFIRNGRVGSQLKLADSAHYPLPSPGAKLLPTPREVFWEKHATQHKQTLHVVNPTPSPPEFANTGLYPHHAGNKGKGMLEHPAPAPENWFSIRGRHWLASSPVDLNSQGKTTATAVPQWRSEQGTYVEHVSPGWSRKVRTRTPDGRAISGNSESVRHYQNEIDLHNRMSMVPGVSETMRQSNVAVNPTTVAKFDAHGRWIDYSSRAYGGPFGERPPRSYDAADLRPHSTSSLLGRGPLRNVVTVSQSVPLIVSPMKDGRAGLLAGPAPALPHAGSFVLVPRETGSSRDVDREGEWEGLRGTRGSAGSVAGVNDVYRLGLSLQPSISPMKVGVARDEGREEPVSPSLPTLLPSGVAHPRPHPFPFKPLTSRENAVNLFARENALEMSAIIPLVFESAGPALQLDPLSSDRLSGQSRHSSLHVSSIADLPTAHFSRDRAGAGESGAWAARSVAAEDALAGLAVTGACTADPAAYPTPAVVPHPDAYLTRKGRLVTSTSTAGSRSAVYFPGPDGAPLRPVGGSLILPGDVGSAIRDSRARSGLTVGPGAVPRPMTVAEMRTASMPLVGGGRAVRDLVSSPYGLIDEGTYIRTDWETLAPRAVRRDPAAVAAQAGLTSSQAAFARTGTGSHLEAYSSSPGQIGPGSRPASMHKALRTHAGVNEGLADRWAVPKPGTAPAGSVTGAASSGVPGFDVQRLRVRIPGAHVEHDAVFPHSPSPFSFLPALSPAQNQHAAGVPSELAAHATGAAGRVVYTDVHPVSLLKPVGSALGKARQAQASAHDEWVRTQVPASVGAGQPGSSAAALESRVGPRPSGVVNSDIHDGAAWSRSALGRDSVREATYGVEGAYSTEMNGRQIDPPPFPLPSFLPMPFYVGVWQARDAEARAAAVGGAGQPPYLFTPQAFPSSSSSLRDGAAMHGYCGYGLPGYGQGVSQGLERGRAPSNREGGRGALRGSGESIPMWDGQGGGGEARPTSRPSSIGSLGRTGKRIAPAGQRPGESSGVHAALSLTLSARVRSPGANSSPSPSPHPESPSSPSPPPALVAAAQDAFANGSPSPRSRFLGPYASVLSVDAPVSISSLTQCGGAFPVHGGDSRGGAREGGSIQGGTAGTVKSYDSMLDMLRREVRLGM